ncbi:MAG: flagellar biosynthetic protein FliO [Planctomycetota bacterium]
MNFDRRLLWLSPLFALALVFGPDANEPKVRTAEGYTTESRADGASATQAEPTPDAPEPRTQRSRRRAAQSPAVPGTSEVLIALGAVLAVGGAALYLLRKAKALPQGSESSAVRLRQSLRVGARHSVHALEFDGRILLVGETEKGLTVLDRMPGAGELEETGVDLADTTTRTQPETTVTVPRPTALQTRTTATSSAAEDSVSARTKFEPLLRHLQRSDSTE